MTAPLWMFKMGQEEINANLVIWSLGLSMDNMYQFSEVGCWYNDLQCLNYMIEFDVYNNPAR